MAGALVHPNSILASLAEADWGRMKASFSEVPLNHGDVVQHADKPLQQVYFLTAGVVSTVALFENGASVEMATTGAEGMVGIGAILGGQRAINRHVVQIPGKALAIDFGAFQRWQQEIPAFQQILLNYTQAFIAQILQSVACNAVHSVQDRAARWLLTCDDRSDGRTFALTQQFFSEMLGVSRPMINTIARTFQNAGYIRYRRGVITIEDRAALEEVSCECYGIIRQAYEDRSIRLKPSGPSQI
jgi:CRP-like cAMP-binding protein